MSSLSLKSLKWLARSGAFALGMAVITPLTYGVEYRFDPAVNSRLLFDDNLDLKIPGREIASFGLSVTPELRATATADKWQFLVDSKFKFIKFEDDVFSSEDQDVALRVSRSSPLTIFQLDLSNTRRADVTSGIVDIDELARRNERVDRQTLAPAFQWVLSPKNRIVIGGTLENTHYDALVFNDYDYAGLNVGWTHQWDERTLLEANIEATDFQSESPVQLVQNTPSCSGAIVQNTNEFSSESVGLNVGITRQFTERLSMSAGAGRRETDSEALSVTCGLFFGFIPVFQEETPTSSAGSTLLDLGLNYVGEKYSVELALARSIQPVGLGFLSQRDSFRLNVDYSLSEKLIARFTTSYSSADGLDEGLSENLFSRENFFIQPSLRWRATEKWTLNGGVRYRQVENEDALGISRDGIQVFIGARYKFKPTLLSR